MSNQGVKIPITGEDSNFSKKLSDAKKNARSAADEMQKKIEEANETVRKANDETSADLKKSLQADAKAAQDAAKKAVDAYKQAKKEETALINNSAKNNADFVGGLNKIAVGAATAVGTVGAAIAGIGISYNSQMEQYLAGFTTMLGNAEKAQSTLNDLRAFAEKTPFELTDFASASTTLMAFGEDVNSLMPDLKMLGDISLGNSEKFKSLALVFGQVQSQGKLMGQDLLQMINSGFNPLQVISKKTGESMSSLKDKMSQGEISFEMVADAMRTATSYGGQFYNAMESQSRTLSGQWSTLQDNVKSFAGSVTEDLSGALTENVLPELIEKVEELKLAWEDGRLQHAIGTATSAAAAFGGALVVLNGAVIANDFLQMAKGVEGFTAATKLGTAAQKAMNVELLKNPWTLALTAVAALTAGIAVYAATHKTEAAKLQDSLKEMQDTVSELTKSNEDNVGSIEKSAAASTQEAEKVKILRDRLFELDGQLKNGNLSQEEATDVMEDFKVVADELGDIIPDITSSLYDETGEIRVQSDAVNDLCDSYINLALAKARAKAAEDKLAEIHKNILDQEEIKDKNYKIVEEYQSAPRGQKDKGVGNWAEAGALKVNAQVAAQNYLTAEENIAKLKESVEGVTDYLIDAQKEINSFATTEEKSTDSTQKNQKKQTKSVKTETDKRIKEYKSEKNTVDYQYKMGEISSEEYYNKLSSLRDKYLEAESEEWYNATLELKTFKEKMTEDELKKREEAYKIELEALEYKNKSGEISEANYYGNLKKIRDKYFEESSEEWKEHTLKLETYKDKLIKEWTTARDDVADKLRGNIKLFDVVSTSVAIEGQEVNSYKDAKLTDIKPQTEALKTYFDLMDKLKERGNVPSELLNNIANLSIEEGALFAESLLGLGDKEFEEYISAWSEYQEFCQKKANELMTDEYAELKNNLLTVFGEVPEELYSLGVESAKEFNNGFQQGLNDESLVGGDAETAYSTAEFNRAQHVENNETLNNNTSEELLNIGVNSAEKIKEGLSKELEDAKQILIDSFGEVPDNFFNLGILSANEFSNGFEYTIENAMNMIFEKLRIQAEMFLNSIGGNGGNSYVTNHYSSTYNVQPSDGESTQAQLQAIRRADTIEQMRGGY